MFSPRLYPALVLSVLTLVTSACGAPTDTATDPSSPVSIDEGPIVRPELSGVPLSPATEPPQCEDCAFTVQFSGAPLVIRRGEESGFTVGIAEDDSEREVELELVDLPEGLSAEPASLSAGYVTRLSLSASDDAAVGGPYALLLRARSGDDVVEHQLSVYVADAPGVLDTSFGRGGVSQLSVTGRADATLHGAALTPDGGVWLVGAAHGDGPREAFATRVRTDGAAHNTPILPFATALMDVAVDADGRVVLHGVRTDASDDVQHFVSLGAPSAEGFRAAIPELEFPTEGPGQLFLAEGRVYLVGDGVSAFTLDGAPHASFAESGAAAGLGPLLDAAPDGRGGLYTLRGGEHGVAAAHVEASGQLDSRFGDHGVVEFSTPAQMRGAHIRATSDGFFSIVASYEGGGRAGRVIARFADDGTLDEDRGGMWVDDGPSTLLDYRVDPVDGHLILKSEENSRGELQTIVTRVDVGGANDLAFGQGGKVRVQMGARRILVDRVVGRAYLVGEGGAGTLVVTRLWL